MHLQTQEQRAEQICKQRSNRSKYAWDMVLYKVKKHCWVAMPDAVSLNKWTWTARATVCPLEKTAPNSVDAVSDGIKMVHTNTHAKGSCLPGRTPGRGSGCPSSRTWAAHSWTPHAAGAVAGPGTGGARSGTAGPRGTSPSTPGMTHCLLPSSVSVSSHCHASPVRCRPPPAGPSDLVSSAHASTHCHQSQGEALWPEP